MKRQSVFADQKQSPRHHVSSAQLFYVSHTCQPQVLSHHYDLLCPPETTEAFRIAEDNIETLYERQYDSNSKADKLALGEARWRLERMIVSRNNLRRTISS